MPQPARNAGVEGVAMPVHDWTRVTAGTFHSFHHSWITHLMEALNAGLLPPGYYPMSEQVASRMQTDLLALHAAGARPPSSAGGPTGALEAAPTVRLHLLPD